MVLLQCETRGNTSTRGYPLQDSRAMFLTKIFSFVTLQYMYKLLCVLAIRGRDQYFINPDYSYYDKPTENFPSF